MVGVTLKRDYDINRKLANLSVRVEYLERRTLALEARGQFQAFSPALSGATGTVEEARYTRVGNMVHMWVSADLANVTGIIEVEVPSGLPILTPAEPRRPLGTAIARSNGASGLNVTPGVVIANPAGTGVAFRSAGATWMTGVPFAWASGSVLAFEATYETSA
jgi:hypothetical protein